MGLTGQGDHQDADDKHTAPLSVQQMALELAGSVCTLPAMHVLSKMPRAHGL